MLVQHYPKPSSCRLFLLVAGRFHGYRFYCVLVHLQVVSVSSDTTSLKKFTRQVLLAVACKLMRLNFHLFKKKTFVV